MPPEEPLDWNLKLGSRDPVEGFHECILGEVDSVGGGEGDRKLI